MSGEATGTGLAIASGDRAVVTGAAGFIGSAVVRALLLRGVRVVALIEPGGVDQNLHGLDVERLTVDMRDRDAVADACHRARFIFHLAAMYRFWAPSQGLLRRQRRWCAQRARRGPPERL